MNKPVKSQVLPVFLPNNFDADALLEREKMNITKRSNIKAAMYYILDTLYHMAAKREYRDYYDQYGGYPLNSKILNHCLGKRYVQALALLEKYGVIIRSDGYKVGSQSKLVCLTEKYNTAAIKIREIPADATIKTKLLAERASYENENAKALGKIPYITKWFDSTRLSINARKAHDFIEFYRASLIARIPKLLPKGRTRNEIESRINQRVNSMISAIESFNRGEMRLSKTGKDHRLHSFLSNTKKELRMLYLFDGKPLVSIDLKSSQPYLLNYLLYFENWEKIVKSILSPSHSDTLSHQELQELSSILMFGGFQGNNSSYSLNKDGLASISWEDDFYCQLVARAKVENMTDVFPDRTTAKKAIMMIFFDDGWYKDNSKEFLLFSKWFPREAALIQFLKKVSRRIKVDDTDPVIISNLLPVLLQRLESNILLEKVCQVISIELPDAPLLPVHDCIHTTEEYAAGVNEIMRRELTKMMGIVPGITIEKYSLQNTFDGLSKLADEDMADIMRKKSNLSIAVGLKPPLFLLLPRNDGDMLISERYITPGYYDENEHIIHLIDDVK